MGNSDVTQHSKWSYTISDDTEKRNRYVNVHPFNYNRIHLEATHGENDYINASHIVIKQTDGEERQYVVTQVCY
jgi:protein-tyrosine phosphatase